LTAMPFSPVSVFTKPNLKGRKVKKLGLMTILIILPILPLAGCNKTESSKMAAVQYQPTPQSILTPDRVETRLGTLSFFDGYPSPETVDTVYDNLDFQRGVRAFLDGLPIASLYAMREGLREVGCRQRHGRYLRELDGFANAVPDSQHRERLRCDLARSEGRAYGGGERAEHPRHPR
jgi:hypothetical protein